MLAAPIAGGPCPANMLGEAPSTRRCRKRQPNKMTRRKIPISLALGATLFLASATPAPAKKTPPKHPIDINLASAKELEELPGVGPTTAKAIIQFREKTGRFRRVEDLLAIRGISAT